LRSDCNGRIYDVFVLLVSGRGGGGEEEEKEKEKEKEKEEEKIGVLRLGL